MENEKVLCNCCGKEMKKRNGILQEDGLFVLKEWGYFSEKDLQIHRFNLCEKCYDQFVQKFVIPVEVSEKRTPLDG